MRFILITLITFFSRNVLVANEPDEWVLAQNAYQEKQYTQALEYIALREKKLSAPSSDVVYAKALTLWGAQNKPLAIANFVKALELRRSFWERYQDANLLLLLQRDIGIREGFSDWPLFQAYFVFGRTLSLWAVSLCFWLVAFSIFFLQRKSRRFKWKAIFCLLLAGVTGVTSIGWHLFSKRHFHLAVIQPVTHEIEIQVYSQPKVADAHKLVELPSGTLVNIDKKSEGFYSINAPLAGWVPNQNVATLD